MKKKGKNHKRNHLAARPPMLVMRNIVNTDLETKELAAVYSFQWGVAQKAHYDLLLDLTNLLMVAGSSNKSRKYAVNVAEKHFLPALKAIKDRFDRTGKLGVAAKEIEILHELVEFSKQFWNRQPIELYDVAVKELKAFYQSLTTSKEDGFVNG